MVNFKSRLRKPGRSRNNSNEKKIELDYESENLRLGKDLDANLRTIKNVLDKCSDVVYREFVLAQNEEVRLALINIDGLSDKTQVTQSIIRALELEIPALDPGREITKARALEFIKQQSLCTDQISETDKLQDIIRGILSGDTILLVDGHSTAIVNSIRHWESRSISEPTVEPVVRGPRESFVETLRTNTALIRRKIKSPGLKIETITLGRVTGTDMAIAYIEGIVDEKLVAEVKNRLNRIDIDSVLDTGYIEGLIEDSPLSVFPTINNTERPDKVAAMLLEGRVAILVDGSPFVLTMPNLFVEYIHSPEDYYQRFWFSSFVRIIRLLAMIISLTVPALYIAITSYHHDLLPTALLLSLAAQHESVPYPVLVEVLVMDLSFEILREAGLRLPRPIGQAVSIVGALVIGEAAVRAGLVAEATVIVVALTGIASFVFSYAASVALRLLRFILMILAATLGLYGLVSGITVIGLHLCSLRSFGMPYLYPLIPTSDSSFLRDTIFRAPWWSMYARPRLMAGRNSKRMGKGLKPAPPK